MENELFTTGDRIKKVLRENNELTSREISELTGCPLCSVKTVLNNMRKRCEVKSKLIKYPTHKWMLNGKS